MRKRLVCIIVVICIVFISSFGNNSSTFKIVKYNGDNLKISIDGVEVNTLPTKGNYYLADYDCDSANTKVSWNKDNYELKVSSNKKENSVVCKLDFQSQPSLSSMSVGSYVKYTGNNGCVGKSCDGNNANYLNDNSMGYCGNDNYKFVTNGWRIAYVEDGNVYLVSAGATDCMCTNGNGNSSNSSCSSYLSRDNLNKHINNMNNVALKYCNSNYVAGGECNDKVAWGMSGNDFEKMFKSELNISDCNNKFGNKLCGYTNDLIDNGGMYSIATIYDKLMENFFYWRADYRGIDNSNSSYLYGIRPIIKLDSTIVVVSGEGTYESPYVIDNNTFVVNNGDVNVTDKSNIKLRLSGSSEVKKMCISVETSGCDDYIDFSNSYNLDLSREDDGVKTIYVYYKNTNGNVISSLSKDIVLDESGPTNNSIKINEGKSLTRKLTLKSIGADYMCLSNVSDNVDKCTNWVDFTGEYNWKLSEGDGTKIVYAFFKDKIGNVSSAVSNTINYSRECLEVDEVYSLDYTGTVVNSEEIDIKLCKGSYKLETWGAKGGNSGGNGGYSVGTIKLNGIEKMYFYVGGAGGKGREAGFNGGGITGSTGGAGGGATDIRIGQDSLYARVIVAGGGGGKGSDNCAIGGAGGGIIGIGYNNQNSCGIQAGGGSQVTGGSAGVYKNIKGANAGSFGKGGDALDGIYDGGAGGGGWYGGGAGVSSDWSNGGGGGSGFVYTNEAVIPNGYLVSANYYLTDTKSLDGDSTANNRSGNGNIKITRLS